MKEEKHEMSGLLLGMAAGAAVSAAGMYLAGQNERDLRRLAKQVTHGAENAVGGIENMVDHFLR